MTEPQIRLTSLAHGGGCGCKLAPSVLQQLLADQPTVAPFKQLLVGTEHSDDAAVWQVDDQTCVIATTDFFMPIVDDPHDFGRIAATNAISDVYAMGGTPILALALAIWLTWQAAPGRQAMLEAEMRVATAPSTHEQAVEIITGRCSMCHAAQPVWDGLISAPKAVRLDSPEEIVRQKQAVALHAALTHAMPPNNITEISAEERKVLALWALQTR